MDKQQLTAVFLEKVSLWEASQQNQTSGFEYERSFDEMWTDLGRVVLQESVGKEPVGRKKNA